MKIFEEPSIEIIKFNVEDIITASAANPDPEAGEEDVFGS